MKRIASYLKAKKEKMRDKKGFTLVELVIVILIISILAVALIPQLSSMVNKAKASGVTEDFHEFQLASQIVMHENSGIPADGGELLKALNANLDASNKIEGDLDSEATTSMDPWGNKYKVKKVAEESGKHKGGVAFISGGPNGDATKTTGPEVTIDGNEKATIKAGTVKDDDYVTTIVYTDKGSVQIATANGDGTTT